MKKIESHSQRVRVGMSAMLYRLHSVTPAPRFLDQPLYMLQLHAFPGTCPYQRDPLGGGGGTEGPGQGWGWGVLMKGLAGGGGGGVGGTEGPGVGWGGGGQAHCHLLGSGMISTYRYSYMHFLYVCCLYGKLMVCTVMYGHHIYRPLNLPGPESNTFSQ